jgi:hypothetical protein
MLRALHKKKIFEDDAIEDGEMGEVLYISRIM